MTAAKITISLPQTVLRKARDAVRAGEAGSVSAYVAAAVEEKSGRDDLRQLLAELALEAGGPLTAVERARARDDLGLPARRKRGARRRCSTSIVRSAPAHCAACAGRAM
jgi:Arc/MetJ-type ribon-helix-helix transcriptional regulator